MKKIKIFLASSNELKVEREKFEIEINRKNKLWFSENILLHLENWEDLSEKMSHTRSQDEYNNIIKECDLFVLLAYSKVGIYTAEEFEIATKNFHFEGKPLIYTYFKDIDKDIEPSLNDFKDILKKSEHFYTTYESFSDLWNSFNTELDRLFFSDSKKNNSDSKPDSLINIRKSKNVNTGNINTSGGDFRIGDNK